MVPDIDLRLRPNRRAPSEARRTLEGLRPAVDDHVVDEAILLVSEIVSNSVRHAELDRTDSIEVHVRGTPTLLHIDVIDPGPGFDTDHLRPPNGHGGWGLQLLDALATRWGVDRDHVTRVWFELTLNGRASDRLTEPRGRRGVLKT